MGENLVKFHPYQRGYYILVTIEGLQPLGGYPCSRRWFFTHAHTNQHYVNTVGLDPGDRVQEVGRWKWWWVHRGGREAEGMGDGFHQNALYVCMKFSNSFLT